MMLKNLYIQTELYSFRRNLEAKRGGLLYNHS